MMRNCFKRAEKPASSNIENSTASGQMQSQPSTSPITKKSAGPLKPQMSQGGYQNSQSTYILPATTQSRTLQTNQNQQNKGASSVKSHHAAHAGPNNGSKSVVKSASVNYLQDSAGMVVGPSHYINQQQKPASSPGAQTGYGLRPESGKKHNNLNQGSNQRTSFLMQTQGTQGGVQNSTANGYMSHVSKSKNHQSMTQNLTDGANQAPNAPGTGTSSRSPPQRVMQSRKISGKSMKSNRAHQQFANATGSVGTGALSKKQQVSGSVSNSQIFPSNHSTHANNSQKHPAEKATNLQQQVVNSSNSPPNAALVQQDEQQAHHLAGNGALKGSSSKLLSTSTQQRKDLITPQMNENHQSKKQAQLGPSNFFDAVQSTGILANAHGQQIGQKPFNSSTTNGNQHRKNMVGSKNGDKSGSSAGVGHKVYNTVQLGKPGHSIASSNSLKIMKTSSNDHGETGAISGVVAQSTSHHSSKQMIDAANVPHSNANTQQPAKPGSGGMNRNNLSASQKFLPTILQQQQQQHSYGAGSKNQNGQSPYRPENEAQHQQFQTHNQISGSDYFSQQIKASGQSSGANRSTSQPANQSHFNPHLSSASQQPPQQTNTSSYAAGQFTMTNINSGSAASMQMQSLINKGMRSMSEPAQPHLKKSDSTSSFKENLRQRIAFTVVMKAAMLPKQPKSNIPRTGTEAQMASESIKAHVAKLLQKNQPQSTLPFFQTSKTSSKAFGMVKAFSANTNVGIVRKANEDRISIILNVIQPPQKEPRIPTDLWPKLQIFGVYDGHGGSRCAEYLKDTLHNNIILQPEFPSNIMEAVRKGCFKTEEDYLKLVCPGPDQPYNKAGSCAIVIMVVNDDVYVINVGDSRALSSTSEHPSDSMIQTKATQAINLNEGQSENPTQVNMEATSTVKQLSRDHKPSDPLEFERIMKAGGYIYQTQTIMNKGYPTTGTQQVRMDTIPPEEDSDEEENPFVGPYRVFPGRLSVCRTFGDCEAKFEHLGGVQGVVTCEPETMLEEGGVNYLDYVLIGSDGIFDKLKNDQINQIVWDVTTRQRQLAHSQGQAPSVHTISGLVADEILHAAARNRSLDNISVVFVAFQRFKDYVEMMFKQEIVASQQQVPVPNINLHQITAQDSDQSPDPRSSRVASLAHHSKTPQRILNQAKNKSARQSEEMAKENNFPKSQSGLNYNNAASIGPQFKNGLEQAQAPLQAYSQATYNQVSSIGQHALQPQKSSSLAQLQQPIELNKHQTGVSQSTQRLDSNHRPTSGSTRVKGTIRSRKGNSAVTSGSHSQDCRPTFPNVSSGSTPHNLMSQASTHQMQQTNQQLFAEAKNVANGGQVGVSSQYQSLEQMSQAHQQNNNRRGGLFKVNTHQIQTNHHKAPSMQDLMLKSNSGHNKKAMAGQLQKSMSNGVLSTNATQNQAAQSHSSVSQPGSSSQVRKTSASMKQMKPYKSNQTRRMPENPSGSVGGSSNSRDPSAGSNNQTNHHHRF